jgi:hypothetical protein
MVTITRGARFGVVVGVAGLLFVARSASAQAKPAGPAGPAGPPNGLAVQVLNTPLPVQVNTPLEVTGTVNVPSQSRSFFFQSSVPTCDASNRCSVTFPAVPAGKVLRVTRIHGALYFSNVDAFVALDLNNLNGQLFVKPLTPFSGAYLGPTLSFNESTEVIFTAGQIPIVEIGTGTSFNQNTFNRLGLTGELINAQ